MDPNTSAQLVVKPESISTANRPALPSAPAPFLVQPVQPSSLVPQTAPPAVVTTGGLSSSAAKPARELKVEDALLYLDQVKMEFSDKPHIYNEFLDIMKNFKSQSINTPGVIDKVKQLFRGYNKLILGFNTFLPEGEGYKIELSPEEEAAGNAQRELDRQREHAANIAAAVNGAMSFGDASSSMGLSAGQSSSSVVPPPLSFSATTVAGLPSASSSLSLSSATNAAAPVSAAPVAPAQPQQQAHAIHYVTKIRNRFSQEPETYRQFLKILHTYQKEQKGIKEVLEQVSTLFADHSDLLTEFTYFLPDAVQDQAKERLDRAVKESEARKTKQMTKAQKKQLAQLQQQQSMGNLPMSQMLAMQGGVPSHLAMQQLAANGSLSDLHALPVALPGSKSARSRVDRERERELLLLQHQQQQQAAAAAAIAASGGAGQSGKFALPQGYALPPALQAALAGAHSLEEQQQIFAAVLAQQQQQLIHAQQMQHLQQQQQMQQQAASVASVAKRGGAAPLGAGGPPAKKQRGGGRGGKHTQAMQATAADVTAMFAQQQQSSSRHQLPLSLSVERRFFDTVKEVLLSLSRDSWTDFVKTLELFIRDSISKEELLDLVGDIFGPANHSLFQEFKRIIDNRADYEENKADQWYAIPLAEIDYAQCRKCTPSYRALPADYPKAKCSERNEAEEKILNDTWVSIPIGSEESYSFKHMRKNQFEEALFKVEDERFEVDMLIETNMSTIRVLEPLCEEIEQLKVTCKKDRGDHGAEPNVQPRFALQLEKRALSTVHLNAIARLYGDHGEEILELLRKNPAAAIPVVLKRLRQKDVEWRKARQDLNKNWREVTEKNFEKSFDHRSFYFRQHDKRYHNNKQLVQELAAFAHERTTGSAYDGFLHATESAYPSLWAGISPALCLSYSHDAHTVHRDVFRLATHHAETHMSLLDRERVVAVFRDFVRPFLRLPTHYLYGAEGQTSVSQAPLHKDMAHPVGSRVLTLYGSGTVLRYRESDAMYEVSLAFGRAFLCAAAIVGAEQLSVPALQAIGVQNDASGEDSIAACDALSPSLSQSEPPAASCEVFFGTQLAYTTLRLHHTLYVRLRHALCVCRERERQRAAADERENARAAAAALEERDGLPQTHTQEREAERDTHTTDGALSASHNAHTQDTHTTQESTTSLYAQLLAHTHALVEGSVDHAKYEDFTRSLCGHDVFSLATCDKLFAALCKHLLLIAQDELSSKCVGIYVYHRMLRATRPREALSTWIERYQQHVASVTQQEDVFRLQFLNPIEGVCASHSEVAIQQLGPLSLSAVSHSSASAAQGETTAAAEDAMDVEEHDDAAEGEAEAEGESESDGERDSDDEQE